MIRRRLRNSNSVSPCVALSTLRLPALMLGLTLLVAGCARKGVVWTATRSFPEGRWAPDDRICFLPDTSSLLRTQEAGKWVVSMRYGPQASVERLPLVVEMESPGEGGYSCDTIEIRLMPPEQRTANNSTLGIFESVDTLPLPVKASPGFSTTIHPATDAEAEGFYSLTFELIN